MTGSTSITIPKSSSTSAPSARTSRFPGCGWRVARGGRLLARGHCTCFELLHAGGELADFAFERGPHLTDLAEARLRLLELRARQRLYAEIPNGVEISDGVLYRARIFIPSQVPVGTYETETFLIDRGKVIAAATKEIVISKSGFERFVAESANRYSLLYGLAAVILPLLFLWLGWLGVTRRVRW